ncbi:MAG: hypothetical protein LBV67_04930, partial [Streptococcaceae bacterium]|nr:hypothetical protein [Streptococcaceae bacterium]
YEEKAVTLAAQKTNGYPFLFQLLGKELWKEKDTIIDRKAVKIALNNSVAKLFTDVHSLVYKEMSPNERIFASAMAKDKLISNIADIKKRIDKDANNTNHLRNRLIEKGVIANAGYGKVQFVLPYMREFMLEKEYELAEVLGE